MSSDWRPQKIDTDALARDAQLDRIEQKLDAILLAQQATHLCWGSHPEPKVSIAGTCSICGKPHAWRSTI